MGSLLDAIDAAAATRRSAARNDLVRAGLEQGASMLVGSSSTYAADPWRFLCDCVFTLDEADRKRPIKRFPVAACVKCRRYVGGDELEACATCGGPTREMTYLRILAEEWASGDVPVIYVPKPRRMRVSWLFCALQTWKALHQRGAAIFIQSSKEEKSGELVDRCAHILRQMDAHQVPMRVPRWELRGSPPRLTIPAMQSKITGVAEGADQLRQYTATSIMADEIGTWTWPRATFAAMKPCIEGGGQIVLVSSAYPGFWANAVMGELGI